MNEGNTITASIVRPTVRKMNRGELRSGFPSSLQCYRVEGESDPRAVGHEREPVGWAAEVQGRSVGSVLCAVVRPMTACKGTSSLRGLVRRFRNLLGSRSELPLYVELLDVVVGREPADAVVEHVLLRRLLEEVRCSWSRVPVVVPERELTA